MTSESLMLNLPLACQTLLDPIGACEKELKKALEELSAQFTWLNEIKDKNCRLLSGKSSEKTNTGTAKIGAFGKQPCRNMSRKTVCRESCQQSKTASQKSRNPVCDIKPLVFKQSLTCSSTQEDSKENRPPVRQVSDEKGGRNNSKTVTKAKAYFPVASKKCFDGKGADKIVCATAHEVKQTISKGAQRQGNTTGTMLGASKLNSVARVGSISKMSCEQKSSGYQSINSLQNKESLWRNSTLKNGQIRKSKPLASICESQIANVECHSHASGWQKTSQLSEQREYTRDRLKNTTLKGMTARLNGIKATHLQNQSLNETITVVTEVFELMGDGQPAKLKKFEMVKTKKAPVEWEAKPDFTFLRTSNFSDYPSAYSDQGFADCDQSVNASSDKSATLSRHNSTNQSDNICDIEEEIGALPHPLSVQETNEMVSTAMVATKPNDSGIETEIVMPTSVTKFTGLVKASQTKSTTQKELVIKKTAAEETQRVTRMGQRGNLNFSKTRSINNPATGEQALAQRTKYCTRPDAKSNSVALQKQKQYMLMGKKTHDQDSLRKAPDMKTQKFAEQKRLREEKKARDVAGELKPFSGYEEKNPNKMLDAKLLVEEQVLEERCKDEPEKEKQSLEKQLETETNRKEEFGKESDQSLEQEGKNREHKELTDRNSNHLKSEENRSKMEDSLEDLKEKLKEEKLRMKQAKEEKEREREQQRIEKEKQIAYERAEQQRIEREKKEERERTIKEEFEKLKAMEKERLQQTQKIQIQKQQNTQPTAVITKPKSTLILKSPRASITNTAAAITNTAASITNTAAAPANTNNSSLNSYEITPMKNNSINVKSSDPDDYGIEDKFSDESTDDEEAPKKKIPEWATGVALNTALIKQFLQPPDLDEIFRISKIEPPNLLLVFPTKRKLRFHWRTSSANWNSPPLKD
ncbi:hypothetical protein BsWGS_12909 [Bradybaena similaris]